MLDTMFEVYKAHPGEDEIALQYLNVGVCKAAAVVGVVSTLLHACFMCLVKKSLLTGADSIFMQFDQRATLSADNHVAQNSRYCSISQ